MALDSISIAAIAHELKSELIDARINKIAQTEKDELLLTLRNTTSRKDLKLLLSVNSSFPSVYFTEKNKISPINAPAFCMLLRKHLLNSKITNIVQPEFERIIDININSMNEMGDLEIKHLIIELMGRHSNIILTDVDGIILDSIKRIGSNVSSVREVLPGRKYIIPPTQNKMNPLLIEEKDYSIFYNELKKYADLPLYKSVYSAFTGIAPKVASDLCLKAEIDQDTQLLLTDEAHIEKLFKEFLKLFNTVKKADFKPTIYLDKNNDPIDFSVTGLDVYYEYKKKEFTSISALLEDYYADKSLSDRMRQKSATLRQFISNALNRTLKKYDLQSKQMKDTEKREKYKIYGELLNVYGYELKGGEKELICPNYYDNNNDIRIPLDSTLTAKENSKKYFDRYVKLKRTYEALEVLLPETENMIKYLQSVTSFINRATSEEELNEIREELVKNGILKKKHVRRNQKRSKKLEPFHYVSSDGYDIYIGRNNIQNEELTFKFASGNDWWFHSKSVPGSHVILKNKGRDEIPDRTFEEAAALAAYYSDLSGNDKVEIDYIQKKHLVKPPKSPTGMVIYHTNYSMVIDSDISNIRKIK